MTPADGHAIVHPVPQQSTGLTHDDGIPGGILQLMGQREGAVGALELEEHTVDAGHRSPVRSRAAA
jgi:hypothetical protein